MSAPRVDRIPRKVLLFSGHMIDAPGRGKPRFPPDKEPVAREAIEALLARLDVGPDDLAVSSGACGGDLLFAEAARGRGTQLETYLPFEPTVFVANSVDFANQDWQSRFDAVRTVSGLHILSREREPLGPDEDPYEKTNLWMLEAASRFGPEKVDFICLWNGQGGDGPGGTQHLMQEVSRRHGRTHWLDTTKLWEFGND